MNLGEAHIIQGNALNLPLPDNSVDLVCTSPPYFGLRSYQDAGVHYEGQIGSEATPQEFLDALLAATCEMVRVLKPSGSIFVNLGDKYASTKSLMGIPWRYAIRCIDELGLILRAEIIWAKPNGLPESVTDRVRRSHEQWFHFVRQPRYFSAVDEIREAHSEPERSNGRVERMGNDRRRTENNGFGLQGEKTREYNPLGKLPGSVWSVPTQPLTVPPELGIDHFAAFPMEWPRRIIQGWTPNGICTACGEGRRPTAERASMERHNNGRYIYERYSPDNKHGYGATTLGYVPDYRITGYACACIQPHEFEENIEDPSMCNCGIPVLSHDRVDLIQPAPTTPAIVLDPFGGTGTTALVAKALGRTGYSIDLSNDYCRLAEWRCNDPRELAAALHIEKPEPVHPDQLDLFEGLT